MTPFDTRVCTLGEGPLWHPLRQTLYWFDIMGKKMFAQTADGPVTWDFDQHVSAAGWIDSKTLLIASETALRTFDLETGSRSEVVPLEADNPFTRSNDGRADPWGGFWIGTMGKNAERGAGAIYRYYQGTLRQLFGNITISNAICFAPDRSCAYFTDTLTQQVMRVPLNDEGWPGGPAEVCIDLTASNQNPDGAVTDLDGNIWLALWGAARVSCFAPDGRHLRDVPVPAPHVTCPAFGGAQMRDLMVTTATQGMSPEGLENAPSSGMTFVLADVAPGLPEPQVIL